MYYILCCRQLQGKLVKQRDPTLRSEHGVKHDEITVKIIVHYFSKYMAKKL